MRIISQESNDPSFHRENLKIWQAEIVNHDPVAAANINRFVGALLLEISNHDL
jgi:hypothetical protein